MSRFKTKSKQALTILLALLLFFAMVPSTLPGGLAYATEWDNTSPEEWGITISTDKATYDVGEDIRYNITGFANTGKGPDTLWMGLYRYDAGYGTSIEWKYINEDVSDNSLKTDLGFDFTEAGHYYLILTTGSDGNDVGSQWATLDFNVGDTCSLTTDKDRYSVGDPIKVTARSGHGDGAWVGLYPYNGDLEDDLLSYYYVKDASGQEIDILTNDVVVDKDKATGLVGRYKCVLFTGGYSIDRANKNLTIKSFWIGEYDNPTWTWNEDHTEATATFTEKDNPDVTASAKVAEENITSTDNAATCTTAANTIYTATLTSDKIRFLTVEEGPFTSPAAVVESGEPLGHSWGDWAVVTPATEEAEGLERHVCSRCNEVEERAIPKLDHVHSLAITQAKEATCEESGNTAYYTCSGCGKFFSDAEGNTEIEENSWVIPAKGHAYGEWTFNSADKTHSRVCANDSTHVETEACTFTHEPSQADPDTEIYTCTICGGQYEQLTIPVITTDKEEYKYGEDVKVTTELNGNDGDTTGGWIALQYKGEDYGGGSLLWYYPARFDNPKILQSIFSPVNTSWENVNGGRGTDKWTNIPAGEYELVFLRGDYERVGQPAYFTVYYEYNDPTWTWAEDGSSATATFAAKDKADETESLTDSAPTKAVKTPATCTEAGVDTYTATVTADFATVSGTKTFTNSKDIPSAALGHSWGDWETVTPATETTEGLEKRECSRCDASETRAIPVLSHVHGLTAHPAVEATCIADGNTAYWVCDQGDNPCGKYFSDAEGKTEIEANSWIVPKNDNHDYGAWVFDEATKTHTKTCKRDATHVVTEACTFEHVIDGAKVTHTCTVCGGSYTTGLVTTDKTEYSMAGPIMVTASGSGKDWVGLYKKGDVPSATGAQSYYYYYVADHNNEPFNLLEGTFQHTLVPGEYTVYLLANDGYEVIASTDITITHQNSFETDKKEYTMGDLIMVTATSDLPDAWVGFYDYYNSDPLDETLICSYSLADSDSDTVDIWNSDIVKDKENLEGLQPGKYKVILFTSGYDIDTDSQGKLTIRSFEIKDNSGCEHEWGDWTFDSETKTHSRECSKCKMVETRPCTFTHQPSSDPDTELYTCTVCGGQYEQLNIPVIKTDKTEYKVGENITVTTEINGHTEGWVALYKKGDPYLTSMMWYYLHVNGYETKVLQTIDGKTDITNQNLGTFSWSEGPLPAGEYELVYVTYPENPYKLVGHPTYFTVYKGIKSEEVTKKPTCTETGIKHIIYEDDTTEDVDIPALGHDPKEAWVHDAEKRTHYHECSRCDAHIDEAACTFDEGKVTKEATATEEGEMLYTCTVCGGTYTEVIPTLANQGVKRVYGDTRFQTALLQANELKEFLGLEKFPSIIVATGANYADALSGAYLGYVKGAPILLVQNSKSDVIADVNAYIKDNIAPGGTVYLLGGEAVVTEDVTKGLDVTTKRLSGATRYETNIEILKEAKVNKESILVCDGNNYADSLSASAAKLPILLVKGGLNDTQRDYLNTLPGNDYYLVGGTGVLPVALENELKSDFGAVERLGGADRYETSTKVAEKFFEKPEKAVVAYAMNYPDGLCGGTLAAYMNAPLLLVRDDKVAITEKYSKAAGIKSGVVLGGSTLVSDKSVRTIFEMEDADEIYVVNKMVPMTE